MSKKSSLEMENMELKQRLEKIADEVRLVACSGYEDIPSQMQVGRASVIDFAKRILALAEPPAKPTQV